MARKKEELAPYLFHQGTNFESYKYLGHHTLSKGTTVFRVWAPNADAVYVTGDFNNWDESCPMERITDNGIWQAELKLKVQNNEKLKYKYKIKRGGNEFYKADPYAVHSGTLSETASYLYELNEYNWTDNDWMSYRRKTVFRGEYPIPMNIYEVHLGSWKKHDDGSYLSYIELADELAPYVKQMGYTHIELMPIAEHPFDGSWGYQVCNFYSPTSRFGTPEMFMYFVNKMHEYGIGVIMDWVPAHFPKNAHGLYEFDGSPLYEYQGWDRMEHKVWGTRFFDVGREEVQSFLVSNAHYWLKEYHIDGLRVDAVAAMLYLDYDRAPGEWTPAFDGSNKNYESIAFFKKLNSSIELRFPDVIMAAEESTDWPMITKPVSDGGLGFHFKWNMGWMNDITAYVKRDPIYRQYHHTALNFSLMYSFNENYILPISHDEVVHCKNSVIDKMWGDYQQKFAGARLFMTYMMCHPGKKLMFMGSEFAQFREWDYASSLEWFMLDFPAHKTFHHFVSRLNRFYLSQSSLWECDTSWDGFTWIRADDNSGNMSVFTRQNKNGKKLLCIMNFSASYKDNCPIGVPDGGYWHEIFSTDSQEFGGGGSVNGSVLAREMMCDGQPYALSVAIPPLSAIIFEQEDIKIKGE